MSAPEPAVFTPCPVTRQGRRCGRPVPGVDPERPCVSCALLGATRVHWRSPASSGQQLVALANAAMVETNVGQLAIPGRAHVCASDYPCSMTHRCTAAIAEEEKR